MKYNLIKDKKGYITKVNGIQIKSEVNLKNSKDKIYVLTFRENEDNSVSVLGMSKKDWAVVDFNEVAEVI